MGKLSKKEIFKLQVAIAGDPQALIYNKNRSRQGLVAVTSGLLAFMEGESKVFVYAQQDEETGLLHIIDEAPWQDW